MTIIQPIGVTLLEIMLVLAIAAMIIVMSVRYYQSATTSASVNAFISQLQAIAAMMDNLAQATNSYSGLKTSSLTTLLPASALQTPWGSNISISSAEADYYRMHIIPSIPYTACLLVMRALSNNNHYTLKNRASIKTYDCSYEKIDHYPMTIIEYWATPQS